MLAIRNTSGRLREPLTLPLAAILFWRKPFSWLARSSTRLPPACCSHSNGRHFSSELLPEKGIQSAGFRCIGGSRGKGGVVGSMSTREGSRMVSPEARSWLGNALRTSQCSRNLLPWNGSSANPRSVSLSSARCWRNCSHWRQASFRSSARRKRTRPNSIRHSEAGRSLSR
jgi:hypothetical protein